MSRPSSSALSGNVRAASASGALRSYMIERGEQIDGVTIRATVPVNLRPLEHAKQLGNHFGLVFLDLPVGEHNPMRRLERIAACMRVLRKSRQAVATFGALAAVGMAPAAVDVLLHSLPHPDVQAVERVPPRAP